MAPKLKTRGTTDLSLFLVLTIQSYPIIGVLNFDIYIYIVYIYIHNIYIYNIYIQYLYIYIYYIQYIYIYMKMMDVSWDITNFRDRPLLGF